MEIARVLGRWSMLVVLLVTAAACDTSSYVPPGGGGGSGGSGGPDDRIAPTVSIVTPYTGANVGGSVQISVDASDNVGVTKVEILLDGTVISTQTSPPWAASWATSGLVGTTHSITAQAYDLANNVGISSSVSVTVIPTTAGSSISVHTSMGLPDSATSSTSNGDHYLLLHNGYVLSYNSAHRTPNWVSWELNSSYLGSSGRVGMWDPDFTLPASFPKAVDADYVGSHYDRGHMCPSGDRTVDYAANDETFTFSNAVPQAANNNQGPWEKLEEEARTLARSGSELFIIAGPTYSGTPSTVGADNVAVPTSTWKVVVVMNSGIKDPNAVTAGTRVIAISIPNSDALVPKSDDWRKYRTTVRAIEAQTGFNLLSDVPQSVQDVVETRVDNL